MASISSAGNIETVAFAILRQKGFALRTLTMGEEQDPLLIAENEEHDFRGHSAIEVLGLLAVHEARGENRHPTDEEVYQCVRFWTGSGGEALRP